MQHLTAEASVMGRSCPKMVCHQQHKNPNNRLFCAPCQLHPARTRAGNNGHGDNGDCSASSGGNSPTQLWEGTCSCHQLRAARQVSDLGCPQEGVCPVGLSQDAGSGSECLLKVSLQGNPLAMLSWSLWGAGMGEGGPGCAGCTRGCSITAVTCLYIHCKDTRRRFLLLTLTHPKTSTRSH